VVDADFGHEEGMGGQGVGVVGCFDSKPVERRGFELRGQVIGDTEYAKLK